MDCSNCGAPVITFAVPESVREYAPDESAHAAICPECLSLSAADTAPSDPRFDRISNAFPTDDAAAPLALAVGRLDSLALYRRDIEALLEVVETEGTDPLLVLDRLHAQGGVQPVFDIERRRDQLEQLLG